MSVSICMVGNPDTAGILHSNQHYKRVKCCVLIFFFGVEKCLLDMSTNCRIPVLVYKFALYSIVNKFNVECS